MEFKAGQRYHHGNPKEYFTISSVTGGIVNFIYREDEVKDIECSARLGSAEAWVRDKGWVFLSERSTKLTLRRLSD